MNSLLSQQTWTWYFMAKIETAKKKVVLSEFCYYETFTMLDEENINCMKKIISGRKNYFSFNKLSFLLRDIF